ncbi:MAG: hypothetical protein H0U21_09735, partial [Acidimicrobiia bacterium]|nr:hypothetical protein [Acidimicrobiia bacterium]
PILPDVPVADDGGARLVVSQLEHVVRWEQVRSLGDQASPLDDAIALDVFAAEEGETVRPADRTALAPAAGYTVRYEPAGDGGWTEPRIFAELRNTTGEHLFVAVLDLTDRFRCSALLHTGRVAPGQTVALNDGAPMAVTLPQGRPVIEGALARDWLKVVVSDVEFDASAFDLPALGERPPQAVATRSLRSWGTLERLAAKAISRDVTSGRAPVAARWAATSVLLESVVGN